MLLFLRLKSDSLVCAPCDLELFQMDTTTAFISVALPDEIIYCNPPRGVALGLG
jgi:hypothetical protein